MSGRDINDNQKILENKNRNSLKVDDAGNPPESSLKDAIPGRLRNVLVEKDVGQRCVDLWDRHNSYRQKQLERQRKIMQELDEFMEPIYRAPQEWMSDLHLPVSLIIAKTFHARMFSALMGNDPQVRARKEANVERAEMVEDLMSYAVKDWANNYAGIHDTMDDFVWEWVTQGRGILKMRWDRQYTRFVDVEERRAPGRADVVDDFGTVATVEEEIVEHPVKIDKEIFNGPCWEHVPQEDVLIVGGNGDPDKADFVAHQVYMTAHDMYSYVDMKIFDRSAVDAVIESGRDLKSAESANQIKSDRASRSGESSIDDQEVTDRYQILECYLRVDLDNSGIGSDVVMWVHKGTKQILRATYLWRVMQTGQKPFAVADFHRRKGQQSAIGLVELTYSLAKEIDAMHNMRIDYGVLSTCPFGFYRASSSLSRERLTLSPGELIPLDNPQVDINFPVLGNRSIFAAQEEEALFTYVNRVTSMSDLQFGILGAQGAARTATGARAVVSESTNNLDIFVRRLNRAYKKALRYTFAMMQARMPAGLEFRILGTDGHEYFRRIPSRQEIQGMFDFELEPSSAATNKQIQVDNAVQIFNTLQNPMLIQLGIVTPGNLFEATKNLFQQLGIKEWSRYVNKPPKHQRIFTPEEVANRILAGVDVPMSPEQDLGGYIQYVDTIMKDDELLGQFGPDEVRALIAKQQEAQDMIQALQAVQAQSANTRQMQNNAAQSAEQTAMSPASVQNIVGAGG